PSRCIMEILRCQKCREYTLEPKHCDEQTVPPGPPKFSVEDKWAGYKRQAKEEQLREKGVL
ncbi:MAG TPA: nucleolar RNA-binding Nop10p family protein, partial [Candidatus Nanoarchaeia archaeon]|nr:nucleolar RNA-binding Nop10p family protein [Candidatus Nanoarchaeia archaeon]